jgi:hypothetical protein
MCETFLVLITEYVHAESTSSLGSFSQKPKISIPCTNILYLLLKTSAAKQNILRVPGAAKKFWSPTKLVPLQHTHTHQFQLHSTKLPHTHLCCSSPGPNRPVFFLTDFLTILFLPPSPLVLL